MAVHTNVEAVTHKAVPVVGVKSITVDRTTDPLLSQADGARGDEVVGDLGTNFDVSLEMEADGTLAREALVGFANEGDLIFKSQLDSNSATLKTYTVTNVVLGTWGISSDQANPNGETLGGRTKDSADTISVV